MTLGHDVEQVFEDRIDSKLLHVGQRNADVSLHGRVDFRPVHDGLLLWLRRWLDGLIVV